MLSAHRDPRAVAEYASTAALRGVRVIIAGAGMAAALPGVVASYSELPVIGVPLRSSKSVADGLEDLGALPGGNSSDGVDINNDGVVVGNSQVNGASHAYRWNEFAGEPDAVERMNAWLDEVERRAAVRSADARAEAIKLARGWFADCMGLEDAT